MIGPELDYRQGVVDQLPPLDDLPDPLAEQVVLNALEQMEGAIRDDVQRPMPDLTDETVAYDQLGAIEAWASAISTVVGRVYAPTSPWRRRVAGWAKNVASRIRWLTGLLLTPLRTIASALGASSFSIGLGFPWGVSVSLSW